MTRKDYQLIADTLAERYLHIRGNKLLTCAVAFADRLELDNPTRFNRTLFIYQCCRNDDDALAEIARRKEVV